MAEFLHKTSVEIPVPILADRGQIESLDKILNDEWSRFEERRLTDLEQAVAQIVTELKADKWRKDASDAELKAKALENLKWSDILKQKREIIIIFRNGTSASVASFAEALRDPDLAAQVPIGFIATFVSGERKCRIVLNCEWSRNALEVEVTPQRDDLARQTLAVLRNWQDAIRPSILMRRWSIVSTYQTQWFVWGMIMFAAFGWLTLKKNADVSSALKAEAHQLLVDGLTAAEQSKALELLLAKNFGYSNDYSAVTLPNWYLVLGIGGFIYCVALSFAPQVEIGIGSGEKRILHWRFYYRLILISFPLFIFSTFLWPKLESWLRSIF